MNTNFNSTAYYGSVAIQTGEDGTGVLLYDHTLQPTVDSDPFTLRKLAFVMLSHFLSYIEQPEKTLLNLNVHCIDIETDVQYPVLLLTGNCDTIKWMLENEIEILEGTEQPISESKKSTAKKNAKVKNSKTAPMRPVRSHQIGFEYANRN
jgi:hypothetical protein